MPSARAASISANAGCSLLQFRGPCVFKCEICNPQRAPRATAIDSAIASSRRSSSLRMWVAYTRPRRASGEHNAISSSGDANAPGVYSSPDDAPQAPSASARSTIVTMVRNSLADARRSSLPTTFPRTVPKPTIDATFGAACSRSSAANIAAKLSDAPPLARELPSAPTTMVVMPCRITDSARGSAASDESPCEWMSTNPGATARPRTSISVVPRTANAEPIAAIRPPLTATSISRPSLPLPSKTVPPRNTMSASARRRSRLAGASAAAVSSVLPVARNVRRDVVIPHILRTSRQRHVRPARANGHPATPHRRRFW